MQDKLAPEFRYKHGCNVAQLLMLWKRYSHHKTKTMTISRFRKFMADEVQHCHPHRSNPQPHNTTADASTIVLVVSTCPPV